MSEPLYVHDCKTCVFLGSFKEHDLYYCPNEHHPMVVARASSEPSDYTSSLCCADNNSLLREAKLRTIARIRQPIVALTFKPLHELKEPDETVHRRQDGLT